MAGEKTAGPPDTDDFPTLEPRLFRTRHGQVWLARMTARLDQALGPSPGEPLLRYLEAQRDILRSIKRHIAQAQAAEDKATDRT